MTAGSSSETWFEPKPPRFGRWVAVSILAHVAVFGGLLLLVSGENESTKPEKKLVVSEEKIAEVTEAMKDLQAAQLKVKLDRIREIQGELIAIRDRKRDKFGEFAVAVGEVAPENAVDFQKTALAKMKDVVGKLGALLSQMDEVERTLGELARAGTLEERQPLSTSLDQLLTAARKQQDALKLAQIASSEAQQVALKRLGFTGAKFEAAIAAQRQVLEIQGQADAQLDAAAAERKVIGNLIEELGRISGPLEKARVQVVQYEKREVELAASLAPAQEAIEEKKKALADLEANGAEDSRLGTLKSEIKAAAKELSKLERPVRDAKSKLSRSRSGFEHWSEAVAGKITALENGASEIRKRQAEALELQMQAVTAQEEAIGLLRKQTPANDARVNGKVNP